jgi:hypothetical protein
MKVNPPPGYLRATPTLTGKKIEMELDMFVAVIKAALGPAIQVTMASYIAKITVLEKIANPMLMSSLDFYPNTRNSPTPRRTVESIWAIVDPTQCINPRSDGFTPITHSRRKRMRSKIDTTTCVAIQSPPAQSL